jgi:peptidoglycan/LPS O-acetylase OafA/YrhL
LCRPQAIASLKWKKSPGRERTPAIMSAAKATLAPLTSVRFLAAVRVAMYHFVEWYNKDFWWRGLMYTPISVSYFFVSSGFLLAYNYAERVDRGEMNYRNFFVGRCARLLPVYFLGLLTALPLLFWPIRNFSPVKTILAIFLVQAWSPHTALYWNAPAWALSNLAFFYAILPALLVLTRSFSRRACLTLAGLAWAASICMSLAYVHWNPDGLHNINSETAGYWLFLLKYNPLARVPEFLLGVMAGRLFLSTGGFRPKAATAVFLTVGAALLGVLLIGSRLPYPVINSGLVAPLLALLVSSLASGGLGARLFRPQWFVALGQSSFCLYMLHLPIWNAVHWCFAERPFSHLENIGLLTGIVVLCLLLYKHVEVPATYALRALLLPAPVRPGRPAAVVLASD